MTPHKKAWLGAATGFATVSLVAASLAIGSASVEDVPAYAVSTSTSSLTLGDTVTVTVAADGLRDVHAYELALAYDPETLAYVEDSASTDTGGRTFGIASEGALHVVHTGLGSSGVSGAATLATATFRTLKPGKASVEASTFEAVSADNGSTIESDLGATTVEVAARPAPVATRAPQVSGTARVGAVLTAIPAPWDVAGTTASYEWRRDGTPVAGARGASYRLSPADAGKKVTVHVVGDKEGHLQGAVTSAPTLAVAPAASRVAAKVRRSVKRGAKVTVKLRVSAAGVTPTGAAAVTYRGKTRHVTLKRTGITTVTLKATKRGSSKIRVTYRPAPGFTASARTLRLRVR
ncbi:MULTISPECIES: cohesin domain-containing protein [Mumia]|uniref:cohesin domain-containing protein n=1 Tax=Mumia TaxID=1546255 RepID=UPI00142326D1|nr:cohesin domain-containing protein [Mumia sp. ZJ430]